MLFSTAQRHRPAVPAASVLLLLLGKPPGTTELHARTCILAGTQLRTLLCSLLPTLFAAAQGCCADQR